MINKKRITLISIATLLIGPVVYAAAFDPRFYEQNNIYFYSPLEELNQICTPGEVGGRLGKLPEKWSDIKLPEATIKFFEKHKYRERAEKNKEAYMAGERSRYKVPWTVLATLHYREADMDPNRTMANGEALHGGRSIDEQDVGTTLAEDSVLAAKAFVDKARLYQGNPVPDIEKSTIEDWANAFLAYNRGNMFMNWNKTYQDSQYVMTGYDESRLTMAWIAADSYEEPGGKKKNDYFNQGKIERKPGALAMLAYLGGPGGSLGCKDMSKKTTGNILETAKLFAIDKPIGNTTGGWRQQAKPEFVAALEKFNPGPARWGGDAGFADCGVFVATVMRASGVDPEFPASGTANHDRYLRTSGKYKIIEHPKESDLQPGDILIYDYGGTGHIGFYAGDLGNGLKFIDASMRKRPPSYRDKYALTYMFSKSKTFAARFIGNAGGGSV
ncbi:MAG: hypothetical protein Q4B05_03805 [Candidatus Saccharibacteria bacterium]|nr:hypothetical protein [Candidatus Saccharibacteria bacterium]